MRDDRRLNALGRGRLRAQRGARRRLPADETTAGGGGPVRRVATAETPSVQPLVAILAPVLGCADVAGPPAAAALLWLTPEC
jgi:hypothetical protein